jgi:phosphatidylinositol glycan class V
MLTTKQGLVAAPLLLHLTAMYWRFCPGPVWCSSVPPNVYSYVQSHYWSNGLFSYWTINNLPNFLLAAPILLLTWRGVRFMHSSSQHLVLAPAALRASLLCRVLTAQWAFMALLCLLSMNVQVATRFLSALPPLYWFSAHSLLHHPEQGLRILQFFLVYSVLGIGLFSTFLPWT